MVITLADGQRIATIHYSANCKLNKRDLELVGSEGLATVDLLSDSATLSRRRDRRWLRAGGGTLIDLAARLARWIPDRASYLAGRLRRETPHARLVAAFASYLRGEAPPPTPLEEIDYVVHNCDRIGREIERRLSGGLRAAG